MADNMEIHESSRVELFQAKKDNTREEEWDF